MMEYLNVQFLLVNAAKHGSWVSYTFVQKPCSFKRFSISEENCGADIINGTFKCKNFVDKCCKKWSLSEYVLLSISPFRKKIVVPTSLIEHLNVSFLLTDVSKAVVGWVILSCKSQVFSIISEFEHHFQEISLFVKSTILGKSIFEGFDGVEMWWGKKFIY